MAEYHGKSYDPDCIDQETLEWLTKTGLYANTRVAIIRRGLEKRRDALLTARKDTLRSLLHAYQHSPFSVSVPALEAVRDAINERLANLTFRLALLDTYPRMGFSMLVLDAFLLMVTPQTRCAVLDWFTSPFTFAEMLEGEPEREHVMCELAPYGVFCGEGLFLELDLSHLTSSLRAGSLARKQSTPKGESDHD